MSVYGEFRDVWEFCVFRKETTVTQAQRHKKKGVAGARSNSAGDVNVCSLVMICRARGFFYLYWFDILFYMLL